MTWDWCFQQTLQWAWGSSQDLRLLSLLETLGRTFFCVSRNTYQPGHHIMMQMVWLTWSVNWSTQFDSKTAISWCWNCTCSPKRDLSPGSTFLRIFPGPQDSFQKGGLVLPGARVGFLKSSFAGSFNPTGLNYISEWPVHTSCLMPWSLCPVVPSAWYMFLCLLTLDKYLVL